MTQYSNIPDSELTYGNDCPYIDIQYEKGRIFVSNAVFRLLDKPGGVLLLWSPTKRSLVIKPTTIDDPNGFPVIGSTYVRFGSLFIGSRTLVDDIWSVLKWDRTLRFRIVAKYNEHSNVAIFEMKDAIGSEIPRNTHGGRPKKLKAKDNLSVVNYERVAECAAGIAELVGKIE
jgi:hypothetical protein